MENLNDIFRASLPEEAIKAETMYNQSIENMDDPAALRQLMEYVTNDEHLKYKQKQDLIAKIQLKIVSLKV